MASIILKWLRRCLFICVCAFFLMSHNASAVDFNFNLNDYEFVQTRSGSNECLFNFDGEWTVQARLCSLNYSKNNDGYIFGIRDNRSFQFNKGDLIEAYLMVNSNELSEVNLNDMVLYRFIPMYFNSSNFNILGYELVQDSSKFPGGPATLNDFTCDLLSSGGLFCHDLNYSGNSTNGYIYYIYRIYMTPKSDGTFPLDLTSAGSSRPLGRCVFQKLSNTNPQCYFSINHYVQYSFIGAIENKEQEEATQDAADESADSGDQSAADAENATAGLISVIGGFVNAITSATPTNCKINGKINNSFNMGELDLCAMPVPSFVQIISSLILIAICIPFAIIMFNRFIGLFRSFQG